MRIPFDSLVTAGVVREAQGLVGSRLERASQPDAKTLILGFYDKGERWLLLCADPQFGRMHLLTRRPDFPREAPPLTAEVRQRLQGAVLESVTQVDRDRIVVLEFSTAQGPFSLIAEMTGRHGNIVLVQGRAHLVGALDWIGPARSVRPLLPGQPYVPPPAPEGDGSSPFLRRLLAAGGDQAAVDAVWSGLATTPVFVPGSGAYPVSVAALGFDELPRSSLSQALEQHFESAIAESRLQAERSSLRAQLERVLLARDVALRDLAEALDAAKNARKLQERAELILAYQSQLTPGAGELEAVGYDGQRVVIPLRSDQTPLENAERLFSKAKKAKARADELRSQNERLEEDREALVAALATLECLTSPGGLESIREEAERRRWLQKSGRAVSKEERPFEGHAVRELLSPGGWRVLYGDNATANDYLTTRLAKPGDLWFHVRGAPSAHVVLCTDNRPDKVQRADIEFAARVAAGHSPSKHSSYVSVDYTQRRYVRKPRGANPGLAVYTREKTVHVDGSGH